MPSHVSIIILNWNGLEDSRECLSSLIPVTAQTPCSIILVDNGSEKPEGEILKQEFGSTLDIKVLRTEKNLGFVGGNNLGFQHLSAKTTEVLLLNNDTVVESDFLNLLLAAEKTQPEAGIFGPAVWNGNRKSVQSEGMGIDLWTGTTIFLKSHSDAPYRAAGVSGCAFLMKKEVLEKVGPLDEDYFAYYEETDFCVRAQKLGYGTVVVPQAKIYHKGGQTAGKISGFHERMMIRNRFIFLKKNATRLQYMVALLYIFGAYAWFRSLRILLSGHPEGLKPFWTGIKQGFSF